MPVATTVRLDYPGTLLDRPLIYDLIRQFDLVTNILEAQVSARGGYLIVMLRGDREKVERGLACLSSQGVQIRILSEIEAGASEA